MSSPTPFLYEFMQLKPNAHTSSSSAELRESLGVPLVGVLTLEDIIDEILSEEIVNETDQYSDNMSTQQAKRITTSAVMQRLSPESHTATRTAAQGTCSIVSSQNLLEFASKSARRQSGKTPSKPQELSNSRSPKRGRKEDKNNSSHFATLHQPSCKPEGGKARAQNVGRITSLEVFLNAKITRSNSSFRQPSAQLSSSYVSGLYVRLPTLSRRDIATRVLLQLCAHRRIGTPISRKILSSRQPSLETLAQFPNLVMFAEGSTCFSRPIGDLERFLQRWGHPVGRFAGAQAFRQFYLWTNPSLPDIAVRRNPHKGWGARVVPKHNGSVSTDGGQLAAICAYSVGLYAAAPSAFGSLALTSASAHPTPAQVTLNARAETLAETLVHLHHYRLDAGSGRFIYIHAFI
ncbi:hypothetical protein B0H13DRAFT_2292501 [Mycena leptocephala]|nr:hypothetical protein B0H13DRAFT_2292501 [Mycena leptocephala]